MNNSLDAIFKPSSIAIVGASSRQESIGHEIFHNIIQYDFNGMAFPINPKSRVIHSFKVYKSVKDIPDPVDLAIIAVPKQHVINTAIECGEKGVKGLVVITAGFKETGEKGEELENELLSVVRKYKMRMVGPNCMGVLNTHNDYRLNATFAPVHPLIGNIGFLSQSGALGVAILNMTNALNLGLSMFVSMGNKADISGNDLLEYWENDPATQLILMYLESFGNPRRFGKIIRKISRKKPVIAVKSGRTVAGARAAAFHTGALAGTDFAIDSLFEQFGVLRVTSIEEMFDLALAFASQPLPEGKRVGIVTNAGGPGIMATDAVVSLGLEMPEFSEETTRKLKEFLPEEASTGNPVDIIAAGGPNEYEKALRLILEDKNIDAAIVIAVSIKMLDLNEVVARIEKVGKEFSKPVLGCFMGKDIDVGVVTKSGEYKFPVYKFPESAAKSLAAMVKYKDRQKRPVGTIGNFKVNKEKALKTVNSAVNENRSLLNADEVRDILNAYGFNIPKMKIAKTHDEAANFSTEIGYPVVLKLYSSTITHKSDVGGVKVDVRNRGEVIESFYNIKKNVEESNEAGAFEGVVIQEMVREGKEVILGMTTDPNFGPMLMFGLGGIFVETLKDVQFRTCPITDMDAREMISSLKGSKLLDGVRGEKGVDINVLVEMLQRLSQLVSDIESIFEIDINPLIITDNKKTTKAVDARILLSPADKK